MSEVASLELRVTSDGVAMADKRLQGFTATGARAEAATDRLNKAAQDSAGRWRFVNGQFATAAERQAILAQRGIAATAAIIPQARAADGLALSWRSMVGPLLAAGSATMAMRKVIGETVAYENLIARLSGVTGGADQAVLAFNRLEEISDGTIFTENQLAEAFLHLKQTGLDASEKSLKAFTNIASATGQSMDQLAEMTLSASMGIFRSMRSMGIRAEADGDKIRMTFKGVTTTIGNSSQEIQGYLVKIGETDFAGAAGRQLHTLGGSLKRVEDAWGDLFREVGRSAIGDLIKQAANGAADALDRLSKALVSEDMTNAVALYQRSMVALISTLDEFGAHVKLVWDVSTGSDTDSALRAFRARMSAADYANKSLQREIENERKVANERKKIREGELKDTAAPAGRRGAPKTEREFFKRDDAFLAYREMLAKQTLAEREERARGLQSLRDDLRTQEEEVRDSWIRRRQVAEESASEDEKGDMLARIDKRYAAEMRALVDAEDQKRAALRDGLRTEEEELLASYERRLGDLQRAVDDEVMLTSEAEELKARLREQYEQDQQRLALDRVAQGTQNAEALFGNLSDVAKNWGGEQSGMYRAMFAAQKAFAIASAMVASGQAMAEAMKLGWPAGIPAGIAAAAQVARAMSIISSPNYSGTYDSGGFIPAGRWGIAGERGPEIVQGPAQVTSRADTAKAIGGRNVTVVVAPDQAAAEQYLMSAAGERAFLALARKHSTAIRRMVGA